MDAEQYHLYGCSIIVFFIVIDLTVVSACESRYPNGQKRLLGTKTTSLPLAWFYSFQEQSLFTVFYKHNYLPQMFL